ncbi:MAG TPA: PIN domain-containing protein [Verrucomicrobiae bacterium]|nr:PIN domain-containing protein [Verrucomicrobiae bacterium]
MRTFFDTSVLIASMIEDEPGHGAALNALNQRARTQCYAALHSVAECFATLTGGRLGIQISAANAAEMIHANVVEPLELITLSKNEYVQVIKAAQDRGMRGGAIYDGLLLACARKAEAERILTLNTRHFVAFAPDLRDRIHPP